MEGKVALLLWKNVEGVKKSVVEKVDGCNERAKEKGLSWCYL